MGEKKIRRRDCVRLCNRIIERCELAVPRVVNIDGIRSNLFVSLLQKLYGHLPDGIVESPSSTEEEVTNVQAIINHLALDVINIDLSHISGADVVSGRPRAVYNLLEIFCGLHKYLSAAELGEFNLEESLEETNSELTSRSSSEEGTEGQPSASDPEGPPQPSPARSHTSATAVSAGQAPPPSEVSEEAAPLRAPTGGVPAAEFEGMSSDPTQNGTEDTPSEDPTGTLSEDQTFPSVSGAGTTETEEALSVLDGEITDESPALARDESGDARSSAPVSSGATKKGGSETKDKDKKKVSMGSGGGGGRGMARKRTSRARSATSEPPGCCSRQRITEMAEAGDRPFRETVRRETRKKTISAPIARRASMEKHASRRSVCSDGQEDWLESQVDDTFLRVQGKETDVFEYFRREFPYVNLSAETKRRLAKEYANQMKHIISLVQPTESRKLKMRRQDVLKRQALLTDIMRQQKAHDERFREMADHRKREAKIRNMPRDSKISCLRAERYVSSFQQQFASRCALNKSKEELMLRAVFEEMLAIQRSRLRAVRKLERDAISAFYDENGYTADLNRMHQYYEYQFRELAELLARERNDLMMAERQKTRMADRIKREFRDYMEADVRSLNDKIVNSWQPQYRELDSDKVRSDLYRANWKFCVA